MFTIKEGLQKIFLKKTLDDNPKAPFIIGHLLMAFALWIFLFKEFLFKHITINADTFSQYSIVKFYLNNLMNGVYPLWNPFLYLGQPFVYTFTAGVFNPLIYVAVLCLKCGLDYYTAYLVYLGLYYFVGLLGMYFLSREIFKDKTLAYICFLFVLFSGMGPMVFNQINILLIFVPAVWFFYFLIKFLSLYSRRHLCAATYCLMLIMNSYVPFYFATLILILFGGYLLFFGREGLQHLRGCLKFVKKNYLVTFLCLLALVISCVPLVFYKISSGGEDIISPSRHGVGCLDGEDSCFMGSPKMSYLETGSYGTLGERVVFQFLFSHLDAINITQDDVFFLPIFCYIVIFISLWGRFDRKKLLLLFTVVVIYFLSLGEATPVHRFFFNCIPYFPYFRNLFFFMAYLMPLIALFSTAQLQSLFSGFFDNRKSTENHWIYISLVHLAFLVFLISQKNIIITSYITVLGSLLFFLLLFAGKIKADRQYFFILIFLLIVLQPVEVLSRYVYNARYLKCSIPSRHVIPQLGLKRPEKPDLKDCLIYRQRPGYDEFLHGMLLKDSSGIIDDLPGEISLWVYLLHQRLDKDIYRKYIENKFYLYDRAGLIKFDSENSQKYKLFYFDGGTEKMQQKEYADYKEVMSLIEDLFKNRRNLALISDIPEAELRSFPRKSSTVSELSEVITQETNEFRVIHFDVNSLVIRTNLKDTKFLVYNDSFHKSWKATVNGKDQKIYRANVAFKGIWLPEGENVIRFEYAPPLGGRFYVIFALFFIVAAAGVLWIFTVERKETRQ